MTEFTTNPKDPRLRRRSDDGLEDQAEAYLILPQLPDEYRGRDWVRPLRSAYVHRRGPTACRTITQIGPPLAQTFAKDPHFYSHTYCVQCRKHLPVEEFDWEGTTEAVGT